MTWAYRVRIFYLPPAILMKLLPKRPFECGSAEPEIGAFDACRVNGEVLGSGTLKEDKLPSCAFFERARLTSGPGYVEAHYRGSVW